MPYTSSHEITTAVQSAVRDALSSRADLTPLVFFASFTSLVALARQNPNNLMFVWTSDITEEDIESHLMTSKVGSPPLDILIRTSGVKRLSDYLLWQVCLIVNSLLLHTSKSPFFSRLLTFFPTGNSAAKILKYTSPRLTGLSLAFGTLYL